MKLIMENWRRMLLTEAAKTAQDLKNFHEENWMEHSNMIRGLWKKYGMWKLGKMMNIGIPDRVQRDWASYSQERKNRYTKAYFSAMVRSKPPIPVVIIGDYYNGVEVSYGAIFPKMGEPAVLLKFDAGVQKGMEGLMTKVKPMEAMPAGSITFYKPNKRQYGECNDVFVVDSTYQTTKGWGPLLYDIAMETATILGGGLTSSRNMVSSKAKPVWDYYQDRRSDVKKDQLDVEKNDAQAFGLDQLTPNNPKDDCKQTAAVKWASGEDYGAWEKRSSKSIWDKIGGMSDEERKDIPWTDQSVSKGYSKEPGILKFLGEAGLLHAPKLGYDAVKFHSKDLPPLPADDDNEPPPFEDQPLGQSAKDKEMTKILQKKMGIQERKLKVKIK